MTLSVAEVRALARARPPINELCLIIPIHVSDELETIPSVRRASLTVHDRVS